jgi:hypothetical protein
MIGRKLKLANIKYFWVYYDWPKLDWPKPRLAEDQLAENLHSRALATVHLLVFGQFQVF